MREANFNETNVARSTQRRETMALLAIVLIPVTTYFVWDFVSAGRFRFQLPWMLSIVAFVLWAAWRTLFSGSVHRATMPYSNVASLQQFRRGFWARLAAVPQVLRIVALLLIAVALARPQTRDRGAEMEVEGIDIVIALDMSGSMNEVDLAPNRLEAAKRVIDEFIARRKSDKIGLVVFGREAYTHCPLTLDYSALRGMLKELRLDLIDGSGTAIGNALGVSLARLRQSDAKSRVIILITDGENNSGNVTPEQATRYAQAMKVKTFTILVGDNSGKPVVVGRDLFGRPITRDKPSYQVNPELLKNIASQTGGKAFLATDSDALAQNFQQILDELDRTSRKDVAAVFNDAFRALIVAAALLLLLEQLLRLTRLRQFP